MNQYIIITHPNGTVEKVWKDPDYREPVVISQSDHIDQLLKDGSITQAQYDLIMDF